MLFIMIQPLANPPQGLAMLASTTHLLFLSLFSFLTLIAQAALVNVTVDDASPDPLTGSSISYFPASAWTARSSTQVCDQCNANPDASQMNGGTWHDNSYFPTSNGPLTATFTFNGSAIYVYCALALQSTSSLAAFTNMTFFIDGEQVGNFQKVPPGISGFQYNVLVYNSSSILPGTHTFTLQNGVVGTGGQTSLALFDYLVYSYDNGIQASPTSTSTGTQAASTATSTLNPLSSSKTGVIVGSVVGTACGIIIVALAAWFFMCRRKKQVRVESGNEPSLQPFISQNFQPALMTTKTNYTTHQHNGSHELTSHAPLPNGPASHAPSSSVALSSSSGPLPSPSWSQVREQDAGPVALGGEDERSRRTLPPEYGQVFSQPQADLESSGPRPIVSEKRRTRFDEGLVL